MCGFWCLGSRCYPNDPSWTVCVVVSWQFCAFIKGFLDSSMLIILQRLGKYCSFLSQVLIGRFRKAVGFFHMWHWDCGCTLVCVRGSLLVIVMWIWWCMCFCVLAFLFDSASHISISWSSAILLLRRSLVVILAGYDVLRLILATNGLWLAQATVW